MSETAVILPEENTASRLVYHSWRTRFGEEVPEDNFPVSQDKEDAPIHVFKVSLPLPGGDHVIVFEEFIDGSWTVFFEDFPSLVGGSNDTWEDALGDLAEIVGDDLQDIERYKDNISPYQKNRHQFLKKAFSA